MRTRAFGFILAVLCSATILEAQAAKSVEGVSVSQLGSCSGSNLGEFKAINDWDGNAGACTSSGGAVNPGTCQCNGGAWLVSAGIEMNFDPTLAESFVFEGTTPDAFETTLSATDPTADRAILLPNAAGTIALTVSNVATATALAANGANCVAGSFPLGVSAAGVAEGCQAAAPAAADEACTAGAVFLNATHLYFCSASAVWVRVALATWP